MADKLVVMLPAVTGVLYALTALAFVAKKDMPWALVYSAYALANVGLILASLRS
jgi:FtsH-binding integral membrane protein